MTRVIRVCVALLASMCVLGCSSGGPAKQARRDDKPGNDPKVTLAQSFPPGNYAGIADISGSIVVEADRQSQTISMPMRMEMALTVEQAGERKTGTLSFTRIKSSVMGYDVDTDTPLPPVPGFFDVRPKDAPRVDPNDPKRILRQALGEMIGPKVRWEIQPDGQAGTVLSNELTGAIKNPQMANAMKDTMNPKDLAEGLGGGYPKDPVGVGAIWHVTRERQIPGAPTRMSVETEYELTALEDSPTGKIATIKYYTNVCRDVNVTKDNVTVRDVDMTVEGLAHADTASGLYLDNAATVTGKFNAESQGKKIKMTMNMKMNYSAKPQP